MQAHEHPPGDPSPFARSRREHAVLLGLLAGLGPATLAPLGRTLGEHMGREDSLLFPALLAVFPAGGATLEALRADHAELRLMLASLSAWLAAPATAHRDEQVQVALRDLTDLLRLHIHREESAVFDVATRALSKDEASTFARRLGPLVDLHPAGDDDPGPSKGSRP